MAKRKLTDDDLIGAIEAAEQQSISYGTGDLQAARARALAWYNRDTSILPAEEGRSSIMDNTVADQIEAVVPQLVRLFASGEDVGRFDPIGPEDEQAAEQQSLVINHALQRGGYFQAIQGAIKDALLLGNAYIKVRWTTRDDVVSESYRGLSDEEMAMLAADTEVEITEHTEYPDPAGVPMVMPGMPPAEPALLHDVRVVLKKKREGIRLDSVPPEEIYVSSRHRYISLQDADFVQHRTRQSIGALRAMGYDVPSDVSDMDEGGPFNLESSYRERWMPDDTTRDDETNDPARRMVTLRESWIKLSDSKGEKAQLTLYRVCVIGRTVIHKEEADLVPIASGSAIHYAHSHVGISFYDLLSDLAEARTAVMRNYLDGLYVGVSPGQAVDVDGVNMDDLLVSRPNRVVRTFGPPGDKFMPLISQDTGPAALSGLEFLTQQTENRTGVTRANQGSLALGQAELNKTATGASIMLTAGQARVELFGRNIAQMVEELFLIAHALMCKHSTKPIALQLQGKWVQANPREWTRRTDYSLSVGLGVGSPEQQMAKLQLIAQMMGQGKQIGLVKTKHFYNLGVEMLKAAGYKNPDKFIERPVEGQPEPQAGPPPEVMAAQVVAQAEMGKAQLNAQSDLQKAQMAEQNKYRIALLNVAKEALLEAFRASNEARMAQAEFAHDERMGDANNRHDMVARAVEAIAGRLAGQVEGMGRPQ